MLGSQEWLSSIYRGLKILINSCWGVMKTLATSLGNQEWESSFCWGVKTRWGRRLYCWRDQEFGCMPIYWGVKNENLHSVGDIRSSGCMPIYWGIIRRLGTKANCYLVDSDFKTTCWGIWGKLNGFRCRLIVRNLTPLGKKVSSSLRVCSSKSCSAGDWDFWRLTPMGIKDLKL